MIVLPEEYQRIFASDIISDINGSPKQGEEGHIEDHTNMFKVLFQHPNPYLMYGQVMKSPDGVWHTVLPESGVLTDWMTIDYGSVLTPTTFENVLEIGETPGKIMVAVNEMSEADGVTDYKEDIFPPGTVFSVYAAGLFSLDPTVAKLRDELLLVKKRLEALEDGS